MFKARLEQGLAAVFNRRVHENQNQERLGNDLYYTVMQYDTFFEDSTTITFSGQILVELELFNNGDLTYGLLEVALHEYSRIPSLKEFQLECTNRTEIPQAIGESLRRTSKVLDFTITQDFNKVRKLIKCLEINLKDGCNK